LNAGKQNSEINSEFFPILTAETGGMDGKLNGFMSLQLVTFHD